MNKDEKTLGLVNLIVFEYTEIYKREILVNPSVAICRDLFVAHGTGENLGNPLKDVNKAISKELRHVFCAFYDRHVNERDPKYLYIED